MFLKYLPALSAIIDVKLTLGRLHVLRMTYQYYISHLFVLQTNKNLSIDCHGALDQFHG